MWVTAGFGVGSTLHIELLQNLAQDSEERDVAVQRDAWLAVTPHGKLVSQWQPLQEALSFALP